MFEFLAPRHKKLSNKFWNITTNSLLTVATRSMEGSISRFKENAFSAISGAASYAAEFYLNASDLPFRRIKMPQQSHTIFDSYIDLCAVEMNCLFRRCTNSAEIRRYLDGSVDQFLENFICLFPAELEANTAELRRHLETFSRYESIDFQDLCFNQAAKFGKILSEGEPRFNRSLNTPATQMVLAFTSIALRPELIRFFDDLVFLNGDPKSGQLRPSTLSPHSR